ncbi:MAG: methionyl-tRNA formyltransferase [Prevotellaceae bacterium]|nr:methionyl-tRNA formyltransferase [Prevotellaceae bacterium]
MGTPDFAVASLQALVDGGYNVTAVVTQPDKPAGRGMQLLASAVKQFAVSRAIPVLQPIKMKDEDFLQALRELQADLFVVVAFRMLPEAVWRMPRLGTFNLHASLLPRYRGAAPINWAIINGETETGITTFFIDEEIDTGKILLSKKVAILPSDTAETLHDKLKDAGKSLVLETVDGLASGTLVPVAQSELGEAKNLPTAPKIFKDTCRICWQKNADELANFVRGLSPHPAAWCDLPLNDGTALPLKIFASHAEIIAHTLPIGAPQTDYRSSLKVACTNGFLHIDELQPMGKKRMRCEDFLRGFRGRF